MRLTLIQNCVCTPAHVHTRHTGKSAVPKVSFHLSIIRSFKISRDAYQRAGIQETQLYEAFQDAEWSESIWSSEGEDKNLLNE